MMKILFFLVLFSLVGLLNPAKTVFECDLDLVTVEANSYREVIERVREEVSDPHLTYGAMNLPVMKAPRKAYFRINLHLSNGIVSIGVRKDDLYILTYMSPNEIGENHVYYFPIEELQATKELEHLFPEVRSGNRHVIDGYEEGYHSLKGAAKTNRKYLGLGLKKFARYAEAVHLKSRRGNYKNEAQFILMAVQMISEAVRYKYIEDLIVLSHSGGLTATPEVWILEDNWEKISKNIKESRDPEFTEVKIYKTYEDGGHLWAVKDISELKIGVLKRCEEEESVQNDDRTIHSQKVNKGKRKKHFSSKAKIRLSGISNALSRKKGTKGGSSRRCIYRVVRDDVHSLSDDVHSDDVHSLILVEFISQVISPFLGGILIISILILLVRGVPTPRIPRELKKMLSTQKSLT